MRRRKHSTKDRAAGESILRRAPLSRIKITFEPRRNTLSTVSTQSGHQVTISSIADVRILDDEIRGSYINPEAYWHYRMRKVIRLITGSNPRRQKADRLTEFTGN